MSDKFGNLLLGHLLILGQDLGDALINEFVSSVALSGFCIFDHEVSKFIDVSLQKVCFYANHLLKF